MCEVRKREIEVIVGRVTALSRAKTGMEKGRGGGRCSNMAGWKRGVGRKAEGRRRGEEDGGGEGGGGEKGVGKRKKGGGGLGGGEKGKRREVSVKRGDRVGGSGRSRRRGTVKRKLEMTEVGDAGGRGR